MTSLMAKIRRQIAGLRRDGRMTTYRDRYRIATLLSFLILPLPRIFSTFGTDKERRGEHAYGTTYQSLFGPMRFKRIKLLEIGLLEGASLLAWRCFFPFATMIGIDIDPKPHLAAPRTRTYLADQGSADDLALLCQREGPFDIIVDDGSHLSHHQIFSFRHLFPSLKEGGIYVIEDVQTSFWSMRLMNMDWDGCHISDPAFAKTCYGFFLELSKYLNQAEFMTSRDVDPAMAALGQQITRISFEHNVITIHKGDNSLPSNAVSHGLIRQ